MKKIISISIILLLAISTFATFTSMPTAKADTYSTYTYLVAMPNTVAAGQTAYLTGWVDKAPPYPVSLGGAPWKGFTIDVTYPGGKNETIGPFDSDEYGSFTQKFTPIDTGVYKFRAHFPEQTVEVPNTDAAGQWIKVVGDHTFQASSSIEITLTVQDEATPTFPGNALPTEYWSRPISGVLREWNAIAGNWLQLPFNSYAKYTTAPDSPHIIWKKPIYTGGLIGGEYGSNSFHLGQAYEGKWVNPVVINGILYYAEYGHGGSQFWTDIVAVDLRTGQEVWRNNSTGRGDPVDVRLTGGGGSYGLWQGYPRLTFGQIYYYDSPNQHGAFPYLWATGGMGSTARWDMYDAFTGDWILSMENVPSGTRTFGPNGEVLIYQANLRDRWLRLWNSSAATPLGGPIGTDVWQWRLWPGATLDVGAPYLWNVTGAGGPEFLVDPFTWNVTIPEGLRGNIWRVNNGDKLIGTHLGTTYYSYNPWQIWALNLKPGKEGELLWMKEYPAPPGNLTMQAGLVSWEDGIFTLREKETRRWYGYDIETGEQVWGPTESQVQYDIFEPMSSIAYGKFYTVGYGGVLYAYDIKTGKLEWSYNATDAFGEGMYGENYPLKMGTVADDKVYIVTSEHSPTNPLHRGAYLRCINATTGDEIWKIRHWSSVQHATAVVIADGYLVDLDAYDLQIYAYGKGQTTTSVAVNPKTIVDGSKVLIEGSVFDESPGTKDADLVARFPNGVPAIADEHMASWMEHVYKQFAKPSDVTGVEVTLSILDSNNNFRSIGTTRSDENGFYSFEWQPDIPGKFTLYASFGGSDSYWPSKAVTAFDVAAAPDAEEPPATQPSIADQYFIPMSIGMIVAIIAVGALLALLLLRKRA